MPKKKKVTARIRQKNKNGKLKFVIVCVFILAAIILFINWKLTSIGLRKAQRINGWIHTAGGVIYDSKNTPVIFEGINYAELTPSDTQFVPPALKNLPDICKRWTSPPTPISPDQIDDWGFNVVRIPVNWDILEPDPPKISADGKELHHWNSDYVSALDRAVTGLGKRHIAVILDMHQYLWSSIFKLINSADGAGCAGSGIPAWIYGSRHFTDFQQARCDFFTQKNNSGLPFAPQSEFINVWIFLAGRYKDNSTVIAMDIINEPWAAVGKCSPGQLNLDDFYLKVGRAIRNVNPNVALILEDSQDYGNGDFALKNLPLNNSIYSFHLYTGNWTPDGEKRLNRYLTRARSWNVPLFVGEFDAFGATDNSPPVPFTPELEGELEQMMSYSKENRVNWALWSYSGMQSLLIPGTYEPKKELLTVLQKGF